MNWRNAQAIQKNPEQVLALVTNEKSVFDRHDVARALHRLVDEPAAFQSALIRVMASKSLVELQPERRDGHGVIEPARYSTREMVAIERDMARATDRLLAGRGAGVSAQRVQAALLNRPGLSSEQPPADGLRQAIEQFAVAWNDAQRPEGQGLAAAARQAAALQGARHALDLARPEASRDLMSALKHDPQVRQAMTGLQGCSRTEALVAGIEREAVVRQDLRLADVRAQRASQEAAAPGAPRQWPEPERKPQRGRGWSR